MAKTLFGMLGDILQAGNAAGARNNGNFPGQLAGGLRDSLRGNQGLSVGAGALGGILGSLMGGGNARSAATAGGTAALAGILLNMYQKWSQQQTQQYNNSASGWDAAMQSRPAGTQEQGWGQASGIPYGGVQHATNTPAAMLLLEALTNAARADGMIDASERAAIETVMGQFFPDMDVAASVENILRRPIDPYELAKRVTNTAQRRDFYRLSSMVIVADTEAERKYLHDLAEAFGITSSEQNTLDSEAVQARGGRCA